MSVSLGDLIDGAKDAANLEELGDGPNDFVSQSRWGVYANEAIESLHKKIVIWNERALYQTQDYDLTSTGGDITPPAGYRTFKQLSIIDDNGYERCTVHRFTNAQLTHLSEVHYQPQGLSKILLRPQQLSKKKFRLSYAAGPSLLTTGDAPITQQTPNVTVKAMGGSEVGLTYFNNSVQIALFLPVTDHIVRLAGNPSGTWTPSGIGPGSTLTNVANGTQTMDGVTMALSDNVLVFQSSGTITPNTFGWYLVTQAGDGTHPCILTRSTNYDEPSEMTFGSSFYVSAGATNTGKRIVFDTPGTITVGATQLSFDVAGAPQLLMDGVAVNPGDKVFILTGAPAYDGVWDVGLNIGTKGSQWWLTRDAGEPAGTVRSIGYTVGVQQGTNNGNRIWQAQGTVTWAIQSATWSTIKSALDPLYEPAKEWIETKMAIRALGKEESNETKNALKADLSPLESELFEFYKSLDQGEAPQVTSHDQDGWNGSLSWRIFNGLI